MTFQTTLRGCIESGDGKEWKVQGGKKEVNQKQIVTKTRNDVMIELSGEKGHEEKWVI